jgi:predicted nucleic acid-binding protein
LTYLLDSNVCIRLINNSSPRVTNRLAAQQPEDIVVSNYLILVTHNVREFLRVDGLQIEYWEEVVQ